jgi:endonuclease-3
MTSIPAEDILQKLNTLYPHTPDDMNFLQFRNNFELLIMTILSAQTTDITVNNLRDALFTAYPTAEALACADQADVEQIIHPAGFFRSKAKNIIGASKKIVDEFGGEIPQTIEELVTLPGVGRKTANIVTNHGFHKAYGIAVDTHVKRLSQRLGLTKSSDPDTIEKDLCALLDRKWWEHVNYLFISHGRAVCTAKKPSCENCIIRENCPEAK